MNVSVEITCPGCRLGRTPMLRRLTKPYYIYHGGEEAFMLCESYDSELRWVGDPFGWFQFAWLPVQCRNGYWRWLRWVERHGDGTYSLGNRAH